MAEEPRVSQEAHGSYIAQATHGASATVNVYATPPTVENQNRARFLVRLRTRYRDLLAQSLHGAVHMQLQLEGSPDAVAPPVQLLYETDQQPARPLPPSTSLLQVYNDAGHELLVLGEAGSGKSTLLLELALDLVSIAEQDHRQLLPVIVPLSSWATKRLPLQEWLASQVALLYDLPERLATRWVREERLLPLLDGLDEMEEQARAACIAAINAYHREHLHPLVVASRSAEYQVAATNEQLTLHHAVVVQPLTREQVDAYLGQCGEQVSALRTALRENLTLQEIVTSPLMLSILLLTYQGQAVNDLLATASFSEQQQRIFTAYVERMMARKGKLARSSQKDLVFWLRWLARQMRGRNQTIFYLEHLQPDWLETPHLTAYIWLAIRGLDVFIGMLCAFVLSLFLYGTDLVALFQNGILGGLLGGIFSQINRRGMTFQLAQQPTRANTCLRTTVSLAISLSVCLLLGLSIGMKQETNFEMNSWFRYGSIASIVTGLSCWMLLSFFSPFSQQQAQAISASTVQGWQLLSGLLRIRLGRWILLVITLLAGEGGLCYGLSSLVNYGRGETWYDGPIIALLEGLSFALQFELIGFLVIMLLIVQTEDVRLTEQLRWTWRSLTSSLFAPEHLRTTIALTCLAVILVGLSGGLGGAEMLWYTGFTGILSFTLYDMPNSGLSTGLPLGLTYWFLLGLFQGITHDQVDNQDRQVVNQGIRDSLRTSRIMGLLSGGAVAIIITLSNILGGMLNIVMSNVTPIVLERGDFWAGVLGDFQRGMLGEEILWKSSSVWAIAVSGGLLAYAMSGGLACLRHFVLRLLLWRTHTFPWKAVEFLDNARSRILLQRIGGGYSFPHRLLLDYFADLPEERP